MNTINFTHATMNRDTRLPSPGVVDWLLDQQWSDVIPVTAITYPKGNPDGVTESERFDCCSATVAIGADECCHLQLPVEALEALRSDQQARRAPTPAPKVGAWGNRQGILDSSITPPPELVQQWWAKETYDPHGVALLKLATQAARWGAAHALPLPSGEVEG